MTKLYRKGTVRLTPPGVSDQLRSFLPAAILTLTAALPPEDREVLAYLVSCFSTDFPNHHRRSTQETANAAAGSKGGVNHPPCFNCNCFRCYVSYWVKWDSSPNCQLIHEIIDAFEESLSEEAKKETSQGERRKGKSVEGNTSLELDESTTSELSTTLNFGGHETAGGGGGGREEEEVEKGSMRGFVSYVGDRIWRVWG